MITKYTFEQDQLNRKNIAEDIEKYIGIIQDKNPEHAVSFALNARWGEGKTYFISMWKHQIEEQKRDIAVYYNAWENDDCDSAILPLLYNIISIEEDKESENFVKHVKFFMKTLGINTLKFGAGKILGNYEEVANIISNSIEDTKNQSIKTVFLEYDEYYGKRKKLQESLKDLIPDEGYLWIFIDDLDRCNPMFAINTLECIKHFFNIERIIFIFAIDYQHLTGSAIQIYGKEIDSESYMKKFFDVIYQLPSPNISDYTAYKISNIQNVKVQQYIRKGGLDFYFRSFAFSLRDIDLTMNHIELFFLKHLERLKMCSNLEQALNIYFYFMVIKDKYNKEYLDIIHGRFLVGKSKKSNWPILDKKFIINDDIYKLLVNISNGQAEKHTMDIMTEYSLMEISSIDKFSKHMEYVLR